MAQVKQNYFLPCFSVLCFHVSEMEEWLGAASQNNHPFAWMVYPAGMQGVFTVMGFHRHVVLGHAVALSLCLAVACYNCGFWSSAEACNGVRGHLLWAVAMHLADVLWSFLDTLFLWSLKSVQCCFLLSIAWRQTGLEHGGRTEVKCLQKYSIVLE